MLQDNTLIYLRNNKFSIFASWSEFVHKEWSIVDSHFPENAIITENSISKSVIFSN